MSAAAALPGSPIEELIGSYREQKIPRTRLLAALTAAGASAAAAAALINAADSATPPAQPLAHSAVQRQTPAASGAVDPVQAHAEHVARQVAGTAAPTRAARAAAVAKIMGDYHPQAVVNDPLFGAPLVGTAAIAVHKSAEMAAISDVSLNILSRTLIGDQLVSTWEMTGVHDGPYYSYAPTGARIALSGATVQTRDRDGKITGETLYYDAANMQRQLLGGG